MAGDTTTHGQQPVVVWDDTRMTTTYANWADVTSSREAINVLFGVEQVRQPGEDEVCVQASKLFALSPSVAKRLAADLDSAIREHERKWVGREQASAVAAKAQKSNAGNSREATGESGHLEKILMLFRSMGTLDAPVDLEHSFKAVHGHLFENRFLLGVSRRDMGGSLDARIASICERIGMPDKLLASFKQILPEANHVYFGVEKDVQTLIFKTYAERRDRIEAEIEAVDVAGRSFPLFTGYKWDTSAPEKQAVTRYDWYPSLPMPRILERLRTNLDAARHGELFEIVAGVVKRASATVSDSDTQYLEVTEAGNSRRSFDINIYKAGLRIQDLFPYLLSALKHYAIPADKFESLYQRIKSERFGHLAGGVDRDNKDFMTVYFGVKQIHSSQLGSATIAAADRPRGSG